MQGRRKFLLAGTMASVVGFSSVRCGGTSPTLSPEQWGDDEFFGPALPFDVQVVVESGRTLHKANPRLCGTNIQWVDGGDGLLTEGSLDFDPSVMALVKRLEPSVIRYPGGSQSDLYDWRAGLGALSQRGSCEHFHRKEKQLVRMGTGEFLSLCKANGADPMVTVNTSTQTANDAAQWLRLTNLTRMRATDGSLLPKVPFWEVGNEPYLKEAQRPETWITPSAYATKANTYINALRAVDPGISIGIPLRSDRYSGGLEGTPYPGYNNTVLQGISAGYDYVAVHNAYLPLAIDGMPSSEALYASMMAGTETVKDDLESTRAQLQKIEGRANTPIALTEYNALVSIGLPQDAFLAAPAGAMYLADLLCLLGARTDILMANHWSLIGNWYFGAIGFTHNERPIYELLRMFRTLLQGDVVAINIQTSQMFTAPRVGASRAAIGLSAVTGLASQQDGQTRVLLINKSPNASARVSLRVPARSNLAWTVRSWAAREAFAAPDVAQPVKTSESTAQASGELLQIALPPSSVTLLQTPQRTRPTR